MEARTTKLTILLGFNGTGKTTLLRKILEESGQRALVVTPDDVEWTDIPENELKRKSDFSFEGIQRHIFDPARSLDVITHFRKGILVFDDILHYQKIIVALSETDRLMKEIDKIEIE